MIIRIGCELRDFSRSGSSRRFKSSRLSRGSPGFLRVCLEIPQPWQLPGDPQDSSPVKILLSSKVTQVSSVKVKGPSPNKKPQRKETPKVLGSEPRSARWLASLASAQILAPRLAPHLAPKKQIVPQSRDVPKTSDFQKLPIFKS